MPDLRAVARNTFRTMDPAEEEQGEVRTGLLPEVPAPLDNPQTQDFFTASITRGQRRASRAANTEVRNTERELRSRLGDEQVDAALQPGGDSITGQITQTMSTLLDPVFDMLQIGQFVTAGAALEIQKNGLGWEAFKRAGSEFANALPGLEVDEAADFLGVSFPKATRPSFSEVLKKSGVSLFEGEGAGRWSAAVGGLVLDIVLDPMTYVAPVKALGKIGAVAEAVEGAKKAAGATKLGAGLGRRFIKDFELLQVAREKPELAKSVTEIIARRQERDIAISNGVVDIKDAVMELGSTMNTAERRLMGVYLDQPEILDGLLRQVAKSGDELSQLQEKADGFRKFYKEIFDKEVEEGLLDKSIERAHYNIGTGEVTEASAKAMNQIFERLGVDPARRRTFFAGDVGAALQLGQGNPTFSKAKTFNTLEERVLAGVPTEMDMALQASRRGFQSVKTKATKRFVDAVLDDKAIARKITDEGLLEAITKNRGTLIKDMGKGEGTLAADQGEAFLKILDENGFGVYRPLRHREAAYVLPKPFINSPY